MYALDTNALIHFFKGVGRVAERMLACPPGEIGIPIVSVYEIEVGISKTGRSRARSEQFERLLETVTVLPFGRSEARKAADIRSRLEAMGAPIGPLDTLIAGIVLARGAILVTHNTAEFSSVPGLEVVDWL
jgi:tRNA(fMet)-specific endonuclease VapC